MTEPRLERLAFYMVPEKADNRVVQVLELDDCHVELVEAETRKRWTLGRAGFEQRLRDGYIQKVTPRWEPAGEPVEV